jgi:hypothetical protein
MSGSIMHKTTTDDAVMQQQMETSKPNSLTEESGNVLLPMVGLIRQPKTTNNAVIEQQASALKRTRRGTPSRYTRRRRNGCLRRTNRVPSLRRNENSAQALVSKVILNPTMHQSIRVMTTGIELSSAKKNVRLITKCFEMLNCSPFLITLFVLLPSRLSNVSEGCYSTKLMTT